MFHQSIYQGFAWCGKNKLVGGRALPTYALPHARQYDSSSSWKSSSFRPYEPPPARPWHAGEQYACSQMLSAQRTTRYSRKLLSPPARRQQLQARNHVLRAGSTHTTHVLRAGSTPAPVDPLACLLQEAQRRHFELVTWSTECL